MPFLQRSLAASLSVILATSPVFAQSVPSPTTSTQPTTSRTPYRGQVQGDDRILHALNRLTFGPRPGDLDAVRAMGLDRWFDLQLHPSAINDVALRARLADFPAMQWSSEDLLFRLPSNAVIRQVIDGKAPMPQSATLRAIYGDQIARVEDRKQAKAEKQPAPAADSKQPAAAASMTSAAPAAESGQLPAMASAPAIQAAIDPALSAQILAFQPQQRVSKLIALEPEQADVFFKSLKGPQRTQLLTGMTPEQKLIIQGLEGTERAVVEELMAQRLTRDIYSQTQLQEVMTDFWLNHFNVYLRKNEATPYYLVSYERDVIRPRALGKFEDLLEAVAHSPAMLLYLDNSESIGPDSQQAERAKTNAARSGKAKAPQGLNENYARELMELHTLGVNGGYTQADVIQAARILTGWTVDRPQRGGGFIFDERRHEPGAKKVLGKKFKEQGQGEGEELLHMLATRPATARFLSRKLAVRFVGDDPPPALVDRMAKTYLATNGDISAMLTTMYRSPEFWSQDAYRSKVKTPLEYVVSAARASGAEIDNMQPLIGALRDMGMPLYGCIPPTGYKWDASDWVSTGALVNRMNFALSLAANRLNGITTTWSPLLDESAPATPASADPAATPQTEEARLETMLVSGGVSESTRSAVLDQFEKQSQPGAPVVMPAASQRKSPPPAPSRDQQDRLLAGLLLGSPEFQRR